MGRFAAACRMPHAAKGTFAASDSPKASFRACASEGDGALTDELRREGAIWGALFPEGALQGRRHSGEVREGKICGVWFPEGHLRGISGAMLRAVTAENAALGALKASLRECDAAKGTFRALYAPKVTFAA
ncbi:hypothetical protein GCM10009754_65670 [Amycolatopsis minnesotensis]|uniref:Uncharacterized protein n=1 Tax=Amycolatopsis minnesotensis TaxID=337894 RepID=A0ABP5DKP8_9PSEU